MATYINYGDGNEDATVQGAEWLTRVMAANQGHETAEKFGNRFQELFQQVQEERNPNYGPIFDLFFEHSDFLFTIFPETPNSYSEKLVKDVESYFALLLSLMQLDEEMSHLVQSMHNLCKLFSKDATQPDLRLRLLMMLYNTFNLPAFEFRFTIFKYVLDYAAQSDLFEQMLPYLEFLDEWMADWGASDAFTQADKRGLFLDLSTYLRKLNKRLDAFLYLKRYHLLCADLDADVTVGRDEEVRAATVQLVKDALQLPSVIQFDDILAFPTVKALRTHGDDDCRALVSLCELFLASGVDDLKAFHAKHRRLFEEPVGLSFEDSLAKMRLLTLATMAQGRSEMPLSEVAQALEENEDQVERWVVRALSEKVIDGRVDQLNRTVLVKSSFQRTFGKAEWEFLDSKLECWIDNLESVIKFIGEQKSQHQAVS